MNSKILLIIGTTWPEPNATAAGGRMRHLILFFLEEGYDITFASTAKESALSMNLEILGIRKQSIVLNNDSFNVLLGCLNPCIVLFDRFPMEEQFGWRVAAAVPQAFRILDTEDLHSLRKTRGVAIKNNEQWSTARWLQADITKREIASIYRCDLSLIISSFEMKLLESTLKIDSSLLLYLPFMIGPISQSTVLKWPSFEKRTGFIFIGTGKHAPNNDAITWLRTKIWPQIRSKLPAADCHIYGSYLPEHIWKLHAPKEGFYVKGEVKDVASVMRTMRINLVPLRFGAGTKGKLMSGMLSGTPNITTPIGAEGINDNFDWSGHIAATAEEFVAAAITLYTDQRLWKKAQENIVTLINAAYDINVCKNNLQRRLQIILNDMEAHRCKNFIGSLLRHHTMASTEYLSRWIAEKNKVNRGATKT